MRDFDDDIRDWVWDGVSIDAIREFSAGINRPLVELYHDFFVDGWPESVPDKYHGFISSGSRACEHKGEKSHAGYRDYLRVLAIDKSDRALVMKGCIDLDTDAEGFDVDEMPAAEAMSLADSYRDYFSKQAPKPTKHRESYGLGAGM